MANFIKKFLCSHNFRYQFVDDYSFLGDTRYELVYKCSKCGKWEKIAVNRIKWELKQYRYKNSEHYKDQSLVLPYSRTMDEQFSGNYVGHLIQKYKERGIDLYAYHS